MSFTSGQILTASQLNTFAPGTRITNADGSSSAPAYSFSTDDTTGFYVTGNEGRIRFVGDGTPGGWLSNTGIRTVDGSAATPSYSFTSDSNTGMFRAADDEIAFATGGTQRLTIKSDGDVGIGTTSPGGNLQVVSQNRAFTVIDSGTNNNAEAGFTSLGGDVPAFGAFSGYDIGFKTGTSRAGLATAMHIDNDGSVGIGITTPQQRLDVAGDSPRFRLTDTDTTLSDDELSSAIEFFSSDASGTGVAAYIHADGQGSTGNLQLRLGTGSPGAAADRFEITDSTVMTTVDLKPATDGDVELGTSSLRWQAVHADRYYVGDTDSYIQFEADSGSGIDGTGFRFVINNNEMFKFARENDDSNHSMLLFGETNDGIRYEKDDERFTFVRNSLDLFQIINEGAFLPQSGDTYFATSPNTGTGNDAEWASTGFGTFILNRNSSLTAEKENITADLGTHLTADMIDSVVPKMWNRLNSPDYPEIGPLAEDMDAISPFLAAHGADIRDGTYQHFLTGINKTAYLSLLVLAVKDLRTRVAALESA